MTLTHISLFSGIGGIDLAAEWAGFKTILFVENDKFCQKILNKHWPDVPIIGDIHDVHRTESATLITGGFPCQPISTAGKQRGKEDDRWLWPEMLRVIKEGRPDWVVAENVAGLIRMGIDDCISDLENIGYTTETYLIPACAVNAPHRRDRIFIVAHSERNRLERPIQKPDSVEANGRIGEGGKAARRITPQEASLHTDYAAPTRQQEHGRPIYGESEPAGFGVAASEGWWAVEPQVARVVYGVPVELGEIRALGNAVVPQQIYPILKGIHDIELGLTT
jgi:DNA (cytosine-5)-methyltransferase 1